MADTISGYRGRGRGRGSRRGRAAAVEWREKPSAAAEIRTADDQQAGSVRAVVGGSGRGRGLHARTVSALGSANAISEVATREQVRGVRKRADVVLKPELTSVQHGVALHPPRLLAPAGPQESELSKDDRRKLQEEKVQKEREQFERNRQQRALGELKKKQEMQTAAVSLLRRCSRFTAHTGYWEEGALDLKEILELALGKQEFSVQCAVHQQRLDQLAKHLLQRLATHPDPMPLPHRPPTPPSSQPTDSQPTAISRFVNDFTGSDATASSSRPSAPAQPPLSRVIGSPVRASAVQSSLSLLLPSPPPPADTEDGSAELQRRLTHLNINSIPKQEPISDPARSMQMTSSTVNQPLSELAPQPPDQASANHGALHISRRSNMIPLGVDWPAGMPIATPYGYMVPSWQVVPAAATVSTEDPRSDAMQWGVGFLNYGMDVSQPNHTSSVSLNAYPTMYGPPPASNMFFPFAPPAHTTEGHTGSNVGGLWVPNYPQWHMTGSWMPYTSAPDHKLDLPQHFVSQEELRVRARYHGPHRYSHADSTMETPPTSYDSMLPQTSTSAGPSQMTLDPVTQTLSPVHWFLKPALVPNMSPSPIDSGSAPDTPSEDFSYGTREHSWPPQTDPRHRRSNAERGRNRQSRLNRSSADHKQEPKFTKH